MRQSQGTEGADHCQVTEDKSECREPSALKKGKQAWGFGECEREAGCEHSEGERSPASMALDVGQVLVGPSFLLPAAHMLCGFPWPVLESFMPPVWESWVPTRLKLKGFYTCTKTL